MKVWRVSTAILAAALALGAATAATAQGHCMGQMGPGMMGQMQGMAPSGPMMGPGMMAPGQMAPGMMGQGMGPGMMGQGTGPGMMGQGMMGQGMGPGMMGQMPQDMMGGRGPMAGLRITPTMHLTTEDVQHYLEHYLERYGFQHLRVGEVRQTDATITADIVTQEGSLALQLEIDPHTGLVTSFS